MYMPSSAQRISPQGGSSTQSGYFPSSARPIYQPKKTIGGFLGNVGSSAMNTVGGIGSSLLNIANTNPEKNTLANFGRLILGTVEKIVPGTQFHEQYADAVGKYYVDRYGGLDKAWNSFYTDPVGVALDASVVLGGTGAVIGGAGKLSKIGALSRVGEGLATASKFTDPLQVAGSIAGKGISSLAKKGGVAFENYGKNLPTAGLGNPALQKKMTRGGIPIQKLMDMYPELYSRDINVAKDVKATIGEKFNQAAMRKDIPLNVTETVQGFYDKLKELENLKNRGSVVAAEEYNQLKTILNQVTGELIDNPTLEGLTKYKQEVLQPNMPKGTFDPGSYGGKAEAYRTAYGLIKDTGIEANAKLRSLGKQYHTAQALPQLFENYQTRVGNRQLINFSKLGSAGVGAFVGGLPGAIGGFVAEQVINSPKGVQVSSQLLRGTGKVLQNAKIPRAISKTSSSLYGAGKVGRMISPSSSSQDSSGVSGVSSRLPSPGGTESTSQTRKTPQLGKTLQSSLVGSGSLSASIPQTSSYNPKQKPIVVPKNIFKSKAAFGKVKKLRLL